GRGLRARVAGAPGLDGAVHGARGGGVPAGRGPPLPLTCAGAGRAGAGAAPALRGVVRQRARRRRSEFPTTRTELAAIAAPAIIGLSRPSAASGMAATL